MNTTKVRITPFRQRVLDLFSPNTPAKSVKEIEKELKQFDRITLYRTLKFFVENGILHEIALVNEKKYALCLDSCNASGHQHEHLHFHCSNCDDTLCIDSNIMPVDLKGFKVSRTELNVFGICRNCQ